MVNAQLRELLLQSLEHERGGVLVYQTALECVINRDLRKEWNQYLEQTGNHVEILTTACKALDGEAAAALKEAYEQVEDEEDEHLYHTKGWCRELWLKALGLKAVLPPPEEKRDVKTAMDAAKAEQERKS